MVGGLGEGGPCVCVGGCPIQNVVLQFIAVM